jgi:hypothetical protein
MREMLGASIWDLGQTTQTRCIRPKEPNDGDAAGVHRFRYRVATEALLFGVVLELGLSLLLLLNLILPSRPSVSLARLAVVDPMPRNAP